MNNNEQYYCPFCGTNLNQQSHFNDLEKEWLCTSCFSYVNLNRAKSSFFNGVFFDSSTYTKENFEESIETMKNAEPAPEISKPKKTKKEELLEKTKEKASRGLKNAKNNAKSIYEDRENINWLNMIIYALVGIIIITCLFFVLQFRKLTSIGIDSKYITQYDYNEVVSKLKDAGFSDITVVPSYDLSVENAKNDGKVKEFKIGDVSEFTSTKKFLCDEKIVITYHVLKPIPIGYSSDILISQNYEAVASLLKNKGFINIEAIPIYNVYLGWFIKEYDVDSISIDGITSFDEQDEFKPNAKIIITYNASIKDKTGIESE